MPGKAEDYFTEDWEDFYFLSQYRMDSSWGYKQYMEHAADSKRPGGILLKKNKEGKFMNRSVEYGIKVTGWAWNSKFADLDNDEWQDLFVANGYLLKPMQESNMFYRNMNGKNFVDETRSSGLLNNLPSSSNAYVDFDLDGDLDIALATSVGPVYLYENNNHKGQSVIFKIRDTKGNQLGIGSKITIYYGDGKHQMKELLASGGYKSYDEPILHFGLGNHDQIDKLVIKWSDGKEETIETTLSAGNTYTLTRTN